MTAAVFVSGGVLDLDELNNPFSILSASTRWVLLGASEAAWTVRGSATSGLSGVVLTFRPLTAFTAAGADGFPGGEIASVEMTTTAGALRWTLSELPTGLDVSAVAANPQVLLAGADRLTGSTLAETFDGGASDDVLDGGATSAVASGAIDDTLFGGAGNDTLRGGEGLDRLYGGSGDDLIEGGAGSDLIYVNAGDADRVDGGEGWDTLEFDRTADGVKVDLAAVRTLDTRWTADALASVEVLYGTDGADVMIGSAGRESLRGWGGNDRLEGGADADTLIGDMGADTLLGGEGDDEIWGDGNDVEVRGGAGNDRLLSVGGAGVIDGGAGDDHLSGAVGGLLDGGADNDRIDASGAGSTLFGNAGDDQLSAVNVSGTDLTLNGGEGADRLLFRGYEAAEATLLGGAGDDRIEIVSALRTTMDAGDGDDRVRVATRAGTHTVTLGTGMDVLELDDPAAATLAGTVRVTDFATGDAGDRVDLLRLLGNASGATGSNVFIRNWDGNTNPFTTGHLRLANGATMGTLILQVDRDGSGSAADFVDLLTLEWVSPSQFTAYNFGGYGVDDGSVTSVEVSGSEGDDALQGGVGDDKLYGLGGADVIHGGRRHDLVEGGAGSDILNGEQGDDKLWGGLDGDTLHGGDGADELNGGAGDDDLWGDPTVSASAFVWPGGADLLRGGDGADVLHGGSYDDTLEGDEGNDVLWGDIDADTLRGGAGDDILTGGAGADDVYGDAGRDTIYVGGRSEDGRETVDAGADDDLIYVRGKMALVGPVVHTFDGGTGNDRIVFSPTDNFGTPQATTYDIHVDREPPTGSFGSGAQAYRLTNIETIEIAPADVAVWFNGSEAGDRLTTGLSAQDFLSGHGGNDELTANGGNDTLNGGAGDDLLEAGEGADWMYGEAGADRMVGGAGDDTYMAVDGDDTVVEVAGGGNDTVRTVLAEYTLSDVIENLWASSELLTYSRSFTGNGVANLINGSAGDDTLRGLGGGDELRGGAGGDLLEGGADNDRLDGDVGNDRLFGGEGNDRLQGGAGTDAMTGGAGDDTYLVDETGDLVTEVAGEGRDVVSTLSLVYTLSADVEELWANTDSSTGRNHVLTGNALDNVLRGHNGDDLLDGGAGADFMDGRVGGDIYVVDNSGDVIGETVQYVGGPDEVRTTLATYTLGAAMEDLTGLSGSGQTLTGNGLANVLRGGAGADRLDGDAGADTLDGGGGEDTAVYASAARGVTADLLVGRATEGAVQDVLVSIEHLVGSAHNDILAGDARSNRLDGGAGSDTVSYAGSAHGVIVDLGVQGTWDGRVNDTLVSIENVLGSAFNDTVYGSAGDNVLDGGAGGADALRGFGGSDTVSYASSTRAVIIDLGVQGTWDGEVNDSLVSVENAIGSRFNDTVYGSSGDNILDGGAGGADTLKGFGGSDTVSYQSSARGVIIDLGVQGTWDGQVNDALQSIENAVGSALKDTFYGDVTGNRLSGGAGSDLIYGFGGDDVLEGGAGADRLYGGEGADRFVFTSLSDSGAGGLDRVFGFNGTLDLIDVQAIDADASTAVDDAFVFVDAFSGVRGQAVLTFDPASGFSTLRLDADGDGQAEFQLLIAGAPTRDAGFAL